MYFSKMLYFKALDIKCWGSKYFDKYEIKYDIKNKLKDREGRKYLSLFLSKNDDNKELCKKLELVIDLPDGTDEDAAKNCKEDGLYLCKIRKPYMPYDQWIALKINDGVRWQELFNDQETALGWLCEAYDLDAIYDFPFLDYGFDVVRNGK